MERGTKVKCSVWKRTENSRKSQESLCVCVCWEERSESAEIIIDWTLFTSHFSIIAVKAKVSL